MGVLNIETVRALFNQIQDEIPQNCPIVCHRSCQHRYFSVIIRAVLLSGASQYFNDLVLAPPPVKRNASTSGLLHTPNNSIYKLWAMKFISFKAYSNYIDSDYQKTSDYLLGTKPNQML